MKNRTQGQVMAQVTGTEQSWNLLEEAVDGAAMRCRQWIAFFQANGALSATDIGKAAQAFARSIGKLQGAPAVSNTTLHKRRSEFSPSVQRTIATVWSIETRARQIIVKVKELPSTLDDTVTATDSAVTATDSAVLATKDSKKKALPAVDVVSVQRAELVAVAALLAEAIGSSDWGVCQAALDKLGGLIQ